VVRRPIRRERERAQLAQIFELLEGTVFLAGLANLLTHIGVRRLTAHSPSLVLKNALTCAKTIDHHLKHSAARLGPVKALRFASPRCAG
jgi:hypothetical protein